MAFFRKQLFKDMEVLIQYYLPSFQKEVYKDFRRHIS